MTAPQTPGSENGVTITAAPGGGLRLNLGTAAAIAVVTAILTRVLPTPTTTDAAVREAQAQQATRQLEDVRYREEERRFQQALMDRLDRLETRISLLESRGKAPSAP